MNHGRGILLATALCLTPLAGCSGDDSSPTAEDSSSASSTQTTSGTGTDPSPEQTSGSATARSTVGENLVPGFPSKVVPVPPDTTVTSSAVEPASGLTQLSLTGDTSLSVQEILAFYRTKLTAQKFTAVENEILPDSVPGLVFGRSGEQELLILTITDHKSHRSFSIGGNIKS
jgi:hypothetical protein